MWTAAHGQALNLDNLKALRPNLGKSLLYVLL